MKSTTQTTIQTPNGAIALTDVTQVIDTTGRVNYSFYVEPIIYDSNRFTNFIINRETLDSELVTYFLTYTNDTINNEIQIKRESVDDYVNRSYRTPCPDLIINTNPGDGHDISNPFDNIDPLDTPGGVGNGGGGVTGNGPGNPTGSDTAVGGTADTSSGTSTTNGSSDSSTSDSSSNSGSDGSSSSSSGGGESGQGPYSHLCGISTVMLFDSAGQAIQDEFGNNVWVLANIDCDTGHIIEVFSRAKSMQRNGSESCPDPTGVIGINKPDNPQDHIDYLNKLTKNTLVKAKLEFLYSKLSDTSREYGFQLNRSLSTASGYTAVEGTISVDPDTQRSSLTFPDATLSTVVEMHDHYEGTNNGLYPVLTIDDIMKTLKSIKISGNYNITIMMTPRNGTVYALRVTNKSQYQYFVNDFLPQFNDPVKVMNYYYDRDVETKTADICNAMPGNGCTALESEDVYNVYLNEFIKETGMGLSLFKGVKNDTGGNYTWSTI